MIPRKPTDNDVARRDVERAERRVEAMTDQAARTRELADQRGAESVRAGAIVLQQLRAVGVTDDEIANSAPVDVDPEAVYAWLEGRGPCPVPLESLPTGDSTKTGGSR